MFYFFFAPDFLSTRLQWTNGWTDRWTDASSGHPGGERPDHLLHQMALMPVIQCHDPHPLSRVHLTLERGGGRSIQLILVPEEPQLSFQLLDFQLKVGRSR